MPNLTIGPLVCEAIRPLTKATIDVHLMVKPVDRIVPDFAKAGADLISFHPEASEHVDRTLGLIKESGCQTGLVFNPATPLHYLDHVMDKLDLILVMSVNPGFGGQTLIESTLAKFRQLRNLAAERGLEFELEADGGVNAQTASAVIAAGASVLIAGSAVFSAKHTVREGIDLLRAVIGGHRGGK